MAIKYPNLHIAKEAWIDALDQPERYALSFPSEQGDYTVVLDRPTLKRLQSQIASALSKEATERPSG
jgi:hypothetical protein